MTKITEISLPEEPIDIIMPTHGRLDLTMRSVRSLYEHTKAPFHLIVVDDSDDLTPTYFERLQKEKDNITYIHSDTPYKCGNQIFNIALKEAKYEFVATVMNSIFVEPEWEVVATEFMKQTPLAGIVGFKCLFPSGIIESAGISMAGYTPIDIGRDMPGHRLAVIYECLAAQWAFALLRKKAVVGNLAEDVFHGFVGWDDIDNCFVVRSKGYKIYYCGMGVGYHEPRATRGRNDMDAHLKNRQNAEAFYKRWGYWDMFKKHSGKDEDYIGIKKEDLEQYYGRKQS